MLRKIVQPCFDLRVLEKLKENIFDLLLDQVDKNIITLGPLVYDLHKERNRITGVYCPPTGIVNRAGD